MKIIFTSVAILLSSNFAFADSNVTAVNAQEYANVTITGDAAKTIYKSMRLVKAEASGPRMAAVAKKETRDVVCYEASEPRIAYTCKLNIDKDGLVRSGVAK